MERDIQLVTQLTTALNFNSRAHVERDRNRSDKRGGNLIFQLTRSRGARPLGMYSSSASSKFQLTRSRGARPSAKLRALKTLKSFQLTRSRGARPAYDRLVVGSHPISTHALTWSATAKTGLRRGICKFQLTRSRGARLVSGCIFAA